MIGVFFPAISFSTRNKEKLRTENNLASNFAPPDFIVSSFTLLFACRKLSTATTNVFFSFTKGSDRQNQQ